MMAPLSYVEGLLFDVRNQIAISKTRLAHLEAERAEAVKRIPMGLYDWPDLLNLEARMRETATRLSSLQAVLLSALEAKRKNGGDF